MSQHTAIARSAVNPSGSSAPCAFNNANNNNRPRSRVDD